MEMEEAMGILTDKELKGIQAFDDDSVDGAFCHLNNWGLSLMFDKQFWSNDWRDVFPMTPDLSSVCQYMPNLFGDGKHGYNIESLMGFFVAITGNYCFIYKTKGIGKESISKIYRLLNPYIKCGDGNIDYATSNGYMSNIERRKYKSKALREIILRGKWDNVNQKDKALRLLSDIPLKYINERRVR